MTTINEMVETLFGDEYLDGWRRSPAEDAAAAWAAAQEAGFPFNVVEEVVDVFVEEMAAMVAKAEAAPAERTLGAALKAAAAAGRSVKAVYGRKRTTCMCKCCVDRGLSSDRHCLRCRCADCT